ncbi:polysaccharide deacetylase family protein [Hyphomicrobium sp.]|uniref:polysaccharide deacetylase family protein n=1 Tax=Hyphomicrobium sp. TaxID=82 RepID=UPI000FB20B6E|nr:polysaccharide deacetylase family protein [Hyphomicrobium sp.]RUO99392.1 MAG: polysaccharide deacetylase family protein [Hyphomicrobium sp.]
MVIRRAGLAICWIALLGLPPAFAEEVATCPRAGTLGVSRTVEIDTTGGPGFGMEHYKAYDFLQDKEVVLTFDDGPQKYTTEAVLKALNDECVKGTFFSIGKMALGYPEIIREVAKAGNTVGTHTWSHKALAKLKSFDDAKDEIERGVSGVHRAVGGAVAPFFRFPTLVDTPEAVAYLGKRNIAIFSTDIDSFDFKPQTADHLVKSVMQKLDKRGKGIILMHDIHKTTAKAVPMLLAELKAKGYKIVHMTAKGQVTTLAEYDQAIEKEAKGLPQVGAERPVSSIVKTVGGTPPTSEASSAGGEPEGLPSAPTPDAASAAPPVPSVPSFPVAPKSSEPSAAPATPGKQSAVEAVPATITASKSADSKPVPSPAPASAAQASPAPSPVVSVAAVDSPVKTVGGSHATISETPASSPVSTVDVASAAHATQPPKSISEKLKETWKFWFGE